MKKLKVNVYGIRGFPGVQGGVEKHCEELYPRMRQIDFEVYRRAQYVQPSSSRYSNITFCDLKTPNNKYLETIIHSFKSAIASIKRKPDLIHIHNIGPAVTIPLIKLFGKKCIVTYHSSNYEHEKWNWVSKTFLRMSEKIAFAMADRIIFVSKSKLGDFPKVRHKSTYIPNGQTEFTNEKPAITLKQYGLKKDQFVLFVGRIVHEKGIDEMIRAYSRINTTTKLVIAGSADTDLEYENKVRALKDKLGDRIVLTGMLPKKDLKLLYENCRFFILPSHNEGMPIVILEAISFGKCPLVSDIRENLDLVQDHAYSFKVKDEDDLKEKMNYMLNHPKEVAQKGMLLKKITGSKYKWERIANETEKAYLDAKNG